MRKGTLTPSPGDAPATEVMPHQSYGSGDDAPGAASFCSSHEEEAFTSPLVPE